MAVIMAVLFNPKRVSFLRVTLAFHAPPPAPAFNFHYPQLSSIDQFRVGFVFFATNPTRICTSTNPAGGPDETVQFD